jgi:tRNA 5-methylaminomethyl-2-thiouridine biosynthesis bifunctional protein
MDDGTTALYPAGGWIAPGPLVQAWLRHSGITFRGGACVASLRRDEARWVALTADGESLADAPVMVLAGAQGTEALLRGLDGPAWPTTVSRGQITWFMSSQRPGLPVTGEGYALQLPSGELLCGATAQEGDLDPDLSQDDHAFNLQRLLALTGIEPADGTPLYGRVGWRWQTADRLPIVGAVPAAARDVPAGTRLDHARLVPRVPGLFVLGGLGSRGLTWGPLAGEILASWIDDAPLPIEADLLDAIDPARWVARATRTA